MPHLPYFVWVMVAQNLGEEAIILADAFRGVDEDISDAVYQVSENVYLARWEMLPELEC